MFTKPDGELGGNAVTYVTPGEAVSQALEEAGIAGAYPGAEDWLTPMHAFSCLDIWREPDAAGTLDTDKWPPWFLNAVRRAAARARAAELARGGDARPGPTFATAHVIAAAEELLTALRTANHPEAYLASQLTLRERLLAALAAGTVRAWGARIGKAGVAPGHEPIPAEQFAGPVRLTPDALRSALAEADAPAMWSPVYLHRCEAMALLRAALAGNASPPVADPAGGERASPVAQTPAETTAANALALEWMAERQAEAIRQHGHPLTRDALASMCAQQGLATIRQARGPLFARLAPHLKNPPRRSGTP